MTHKRHTTKNFLVIDREKEKEATEAGANDIEIISKFLDECRTIEQLRECVVNRIDIYTRLLEILNGEFDYEESNKSNLDYDAFATALHKLG